MKKKLLLFLGISSVLSFSAQNIDDQKITFNFIQEPSHPIKGTSSYTIVLDHSIYQASNNDSLSAYEVKLNLAESQLTAWIEQKKKIDQMYLLEMSKWEIATNAGTVMAQPLKQPYPPMPELKEEIQAPLLTEDISDGIVDSRINIEGLNKATGGATVTIQFLGLQETNIVQKITGTGAATNYEFSATYKMPIKLTVEVPGQGIIINENLNANQKTKAINKYKSKFDYEYWKTDNLTNYWKSLQTDEVNAILNQVNDLLNDRCGFPTKKRVTDIYTVKKFKGLDYGDLLDAYSAAKSGYDLIFKNVSRKDGEANLRKAIKIWEKALEESNMQDSKARINDKVTAAIQVNVAEAYMWLRDYSTADSYIQRAKINNAGLGKYKRNASDLESYMDYLKSRELANR
jgi:hypothetical protein